eukprot:2778146-Ditylum_brightwellii.AAC.1
MQQSAAAAKSCVVRSKNDISSKSHKHQNHDNCHNCHTCNNPNVKPAIKQFEKAERRRAVKIQ